MSHPAGGQGRQAASHNPIRVADVTVFGEDACHGLSKLADNSIDLAIVDPPYGASSSTPARLEGSHNLPGFGGEWSAASHSWDEIRPDQQYAEVVGWLAELKRVVSPEGSIWIHSTYHNGGFVNVACQMLGIEIINEVVWFKRNAFPNLKGSRLTASHETILWAHTGGKNRKYRFNYQEVKSKSYKGDTIKVPGKQLRTVWDISNNKSRHELADGKHPTQKPERVAQRIIDVAGFAGGTLLAPFAGSGTELVVGMRNGMKGIGFEIDADYRELCRRRLERENQPGQQLSLGADSAS